MVLAGRRRPGGRASRSPASAASRPGATPWTSCSSAPPPSRWAPASCTTASASSDDLVDGLSTYLREQGPAPARPSWWARRCRRITDWGNLDQEWRLLAQIDQATLHPLQPLLRRLQRRRPPGDPLRGRERDVAPGGGRRLLRGLPPVRVRLPGGGLHHVRGARGRGRHPLTPRPRGPRVRRQRRRALPRRTTRSPAGRRGSCVDCASGLRQRTLYRSTGLQALLAL